jgi:hypothetical protein
MADFKKYDKDAPPRIKGAKAPTKTEILPQIRISKLEREELEVSAKLLCESITEYIRRAVIERNQRIIKEWAIRKKFLDEVGEANIEEIK